MAVLVIAEHDNAHVKDATNKTVTAALQLSGDERARLTRHYTNNQQAWEAYAKGRYYRNRLSFKEFDQAIAAFQAAVQADPNFALAYAALAETYHWSADNSMLSAEAKVKAKEAAQKAQRLGGYRSLVHVRENERPAKDDSGQNSGHREGTPSQRPSLRVCDR